MDRQLFQQINALSSCGKIDRARMTRWLSSLSSRCLPSPLSQKPKTIAALILFGTDAVTKDIVLFVIIFLHLIMYFGLSESDQTSNRNTNWKWLQEQLIILHLGERPDRRRDSIKLPFPCRGKFRAVMCTRCKSLKSPFQEKWNGFLGEQDCHCSDPSQLGEFSGAHFQMAIWLNFVRVIHRIHPEIFTNEASFLLPK